MLAAAIDFDDGAGTRTRVSAIGRTNLHSHPGVVEIIYVLRGRLRAEVSFETFDLECGDFVVVNQGDPHLLIGSEDNVTALVHLNLDFYTDVNPFLADTIFACESFDLARYRNQEELLREMLLDIIAADRPMRARQSPPPSEAPSRALLELLGSCFTLAHYYHRDRDPSPAQLAKFHTVVRYLNEHAGIRDVLAQFAIEHHYSKSWVSHMIKDVSAISFSDLLTFIRVAHAERLLLDTNATMMEVSAASGFSDVKYLTRSFVDWFHVSPSRYRRSMQPEILRPNVSKTLTGQEERRLIESHRRRTVAANGNPRLSITPLLLKNVGSRLDLFHSSRVSAHRDIPNPSRPQSDRDTGPRHLIPIEVDLASLDRRSLIRCLASFEQVNATPCLVVRFCSKAATGAELSELRDHLTEAQADDVAIWLVYGTMSERQAVDATVEEARQQLGLHIQPIAQP
jgi:AraC-like DNA-binding protein